MRRGRGSEATKAVFCLQAKKPLHSGSYEHRVPKIKDKTCFYMYVCVIQHRNWPLRSTILIAHGTNASPDGLCTRAHTNEAFSCWFCCNSCRVDRARRGNVCLEAWLGRVLKAWNVRTRYKYRTFFSKRQKAVYRLVTAPQAGTQKYTLAFAYDSPR